MQELLTLVERYPALMPLQTKIERAFEQLLGCARSGGRVLVCGNGGSAADAEHIVGELMKSFVLKRPIHGDVAKKLCASGESALAESLQDAIPAICLNAQASLMTAIGNDISFEMVYAQQVYGYGKAGDVLIALSTSGNAKNVLNAAKVAKALGMQVILMSGEGGGQIADVADVCLCLPEKETYKVQELTLPVYHTLCLMLERALFGG